MVVVAVVAVVVVVVVATMATGPMDDTGSLSGGWAVEKKNRIPGRLEQTVGTLRSGFYKSAVGVVSPVVSQAAQDGVMAAVPSSRAASFLHHPPPPPPPPPLHFSLFFFVLGCWGFVVSFNGGAGAAEQKVKRKRERERERW